MTTPIERALLRGDTATATAMATRKAAEKRDRAKRVRSRGPRAKGATREERDAKWSVFVRWVRETVWMFSDHQCEHCGRVLPDALGDLDHSRGGADRREFTRIEWCRRLCRRCHDLRTEEKLPDGSLDANYWRGHMQTVNDRRMDFHGAKKIAALVEEQERRLAEADPKLAAAWRHPAIPVRIEEEADRG